MQLIPVGNLTQLTPGAIATPLVKFDYDALSRMTAFIDGPTNVSIEAYAYDAAGNRQSFSNSADTQAYTYPATSHRLGQGTKGQRKYASGYFPWFFLFCPFSPVSSARTAASATLVLSTLAPRPGFPHTLRSFPDEQRGYPYR